jgi:hypothetical protein
LRVCSLRGRLSGRVRGVDVGFSFVDSFSFLLDRTVDFHLFSLRYWILVFRVPFPTGFFLIPFLVVHIALPACFVDIT